MALDTSIEYQQTLTNTVRLAVPEVADYCVVILLNEDGSTRWADSAHRDPTKQVLLERLRGYVPPIASPQHPVARALRTGQPQLVTDTGGQLLKWWDGSRLSIVRALAPASSIAVPMIARGRTFGAILFVVTAESGRRYGGRDLELATDVGRRATFAIDHALLYQAAERAARSRDELMAVVAHDLKNPLNNIQLALRVLLEHDRFRGDEKDGLERNAFGSRPEGLGTDVGAREAAQVNGERAHFRLHRWCRNPSDHQLVSRYPKLVSGAPGVPPPRDGPLTRSPVRSGG